MDNLDLTKIKGELKLKTTYDLLDILSYSQSNYQPSVIGVIKEILIERGTGQAEIEAAENQYHFNKSQAAEIKKKPRYFDRLTKWVIIGIPLIILGRYVGTCSAKRDINKAWSMQYTNNIRNLIRSEMDKVIIVDESTMTKICDCGIEKVKQQFPNGIEEANTDSLKNAFFRIGRECVRVAKSIRLKGWPEETIEAFKLKMMQNPDLQKYSEAQRANFSGCYVDEVKTAFPDGIPNEIPASEQKILVGKCQKYLTK